MLEMLQNIFITENNGQYMEKFLRKIIKVQTINKLWLLKIHGTKYQGHSSSVMKLSSRLRN